MHEAGYSGAEVIPGPSRLPALCRARQLLTGDNLVPPANNLHTLIAFFRKREFSKTRKFWSKLPCGARVNNVLLLNGSL